MHCRPRSLFTAEQEADHTKSSRSGTDYSQSTAQAALRCGGFATMNISRNINILLSGLLPGLACLWMLLAVACVFLLSLGTDEAWVLIGLRSFIEEVQPDVSSEPILTSGGLFAAANLILEYLFGSRVWVHRLFSLVCLFGLMWIVVRTMPSSDRSIKVRCIAIAPLLGLTGTAEVGTAALGSSTAIFLFVFAGALWFCFEARRGSLIICACLFGLAAASRPEYSVFAPALLIVSSVNFSNESHVTFRLPRREFVLVLVAVGVFVACMAALRSAVREGIDQSGLESFRLVTGTSSVWTFLDYPRQLNKVLISQSFVPLGLLAFASLLPLFARRLPSATNRDSTQFHLFLIVTGWMLWLAWFVQAPIPHLRYVWPALVCFAIVVGHFMSLLYTNERKHGLQSLAIALVAAVLVLGGATATFRSIVLGHQDYLSWEWSREMPVDYFRRFQHAQDQREMMAYLTSLPAGELIVCHGEPYCFRYLTGRPVVRVRDNLDRLSSESDQIHLLIPPSVGTYLYLPPAAHMWIEDHCHLEYEVGRYSLYTLPEQMPEDPSFLRAKRTNYVGHPLSRSWFGIR